MYTYICSHTHVHSVAVCRCCWDIWNGVFGVVRLRCFLLFFSYLSLHLIFLTQQQSLNYFFLSELSRLSKNLRSWELEMSVWVFPIHSLDCCFFLSEDVQLSHGYRKSLFPSHTQMTPLYLLTSTPLNSTYRKGRPRSQFQHWQVTLHSILHIAECPISL